MTTRIRRKRRRWNPRFVALCLGLVFVLAGGTAWIWWANRGPEGAGVEVPADVEQDLLPVNEWSRPGTPLERIDGVVIHYVGNPGTTAQANRNYFASLASGEEGTYASSHFIVGLEGEVVQCVPLTEVAYASNGRNEDTVSVEVCHPDETGAFAPVTYRRLVELTAWLCQTFRLDPEEAVIRHYDVTGKACPLYYVENPEAWTDFLRDVAAELEAMS
ncbi:N-acetylmuramoyl-L-alanine amidase family protein [uncultured Oscillibacter sp.]|uniref:peptidoglycan recognition protein family protein n=1 Tax=uncultured Oscillibacter sp. TaxID=876091 RepID=UPI0025DEBDAB|nr:peptidoglycan recognition family protein [uncultured Oscillibacter sp.]